jgi:heme-degrading monooxygenase HmoA
VAQQTPNQKSRRFKRILTWLLLAPGSIAALIVALPSCAVSSGYSSAQNSRSAGKTPASDIKTVMIGITHAIVDGKNRKLFDKHTRLVIDALPQHDGYVGHMVRTRVFGNEVWTMTLWQDEGSLDAFVRAPIHREAIKQGLSGVKSAQFIRFEYPAADVPPSWDDVIERLKSAPFVNY